MWSFPRLRRKPQFLAYRSKLYYVTQIYHPSVFFTLSQCHARVLFCLALQLHLLFATQAMKGFLATQQEAVETLLVAARRLRGDAAFDQQEIQETIETVEERWAELTSKVGEYEIWLEGSVQASKQYQASLEYINSVLNDTEERLRVNACGNVKELKREVEQLKVRLLFCIIY